MSKQEILKQLKANMVKCDHCSKKRVTKYSEPYKMNLCNECRGKYIQAIEDKLPKISRGGY